MSRATTSQASAATPILVVESPKNRVLVYEDRVEKTFVTGRGCARKARREAAALRALAGIAGVPVLRELAQGGSCVIMSRLHGTTLAEHGVAQHGVAQHAVAASTLASLRILVEQMLERGVARHSLPHRDILVLPDGSAGLVDFERSTLRLFPCEPSWLLARSITRFHLLRLIGELAPELLTPREQRKLGRQLALRAALQRPMKLRRKLARSLRAARARIFSPLPPSTTLPPSTPLPRSDGRE
ncbi:MAG: hypothetical protein HOP15_01085 [Planctomycetes bacterium]|nr:hypothetical protein [Planctomycetota bacterium]